MPIPVTPAEILAAVPQTTQNRCQALANALLRFPRLIYDFFVWAIQTDGSGFTNAFLRMIWDVGDFKVSADSGLDDGTDTTPWKLCNGAVVSQTTFASLYAVVGTTFDTGGEGAGNFRLPDFRGKFSLPVKAGTYEFGDTGGNATKTLSAGEGAFAAHNHVYGQTNLAGDDDAQLLTGSDTGITSQAYKEVHGNTDTPVTGSITSGNMVTASNTVAAPTAFSLMPPYLVGGYMYIKT